LALQLLDYSNQLARRLIAHSPKGSEALSFVADNEGRVPHRRLRALKLRLT
jgi:hypothetical protein